jgi:hypothetical protein
MPSLIALILMKSIVLQKMKQQLQINNTLLQEKLKLLILWFSDQAYIDLRHSGCEFLPDAIMHLR